MADYVLSCCSTADVSRELLDSRDIAYVLFNFELDGEPRKDDFWESLSQREMFSRMLDGASARTSQVSAGEYEQHFERFLSQGLDVVHVTLSSGISATYNSACVARDMLAERYPDNHVYVVDSLAASAGFGLLVDRMADLRDEGMGAAELAAWADEHKGEVQHWFFSTDLTFFIRGGRISKAAGMAAGVLRICPLMWVAPDGSLEVKEKIRTKAKTIARDVDVMERLAAGGRDYDGKVFISHADCIDDAREVARRVEERFPNIDGPVRIYEIGATIGVHTGPGTVALFYWGEPRA